MLISHDSENGVLRLVLLRDLDVTTRAAAAVQVEALLHAHHPQHVRWQWPTASPSAASLSVLARARRLCDALGASLTVLNATTPVRPGPQAAAA
ncbi:hypothetical protein ABZT27_15530 [Streptomyces sp. NPDC005389]|uniref:hypothetical protein n=1 Tax=unclassified Streptomyces TaxID=2593676 RepID=UPI0033ACA270